MAIKEKYQALFENSITALFITRPDGTILEANRAACRMFGYSEVEFRKLGRQGVIDPNSPGLSDKLKEREETGSTTGEMIGIRKTGEKFWCEFSSSVFDDPAGGKMASMVLIDMFDAKDRQESLKGVMNNVPGVIYRYVTKSEGFEKTQFVSGEVKQVLGFNPDEIFEDASLGWKNIHEDDAERVVHSMKQAADKNTKWICEYRYHHPDGTVRWLRGMGNPVSNKNGRVVWDSIVIDITAEKRAEARKNEDEEELTLIFDTISDAIFTLSVESNETYRFLRVNNQFLKNVGKPQNQVIGKKLEDVIAPENISFVKEKYSEAIATGKNLRWEESIQIKNGTKTGIVSVTPLLDEESNCYQLVGSISDISERKAAENELTRVLDQSLDVICTIDSEGKFVKVSEASSKIWGYEPEELEGKAYIDLVHPEDIEKSNKVAEDIMSGVDVTNFENRYRRKDGSVVPNVWSARWHKDDKLMYCVAKDATERIKAEELVTGERKRYEKLFRKMPAFVSMMEGPEHRNIMANPVFCQVTGRSEDDLIGITAKEAFPELVDQGFIEILDNVYKTGEPFEIKEMEVYVEISKGQGPVRRFYDFVYLPNRGVDGKIEGILAFGMDVTHQVENRENLKISNERFKYVLEASEDVIYEHDMVADTITLSENFQQIFGYSIADEPFTLEKWVTLLHPDDEERINSRLEKVLSDSNENKWEAEFRYAKKDGNYAFVLENSYIIRDNSGNAVRMIGSVKDITDQKVREIQKSLAADVSLSFNQADGLSEAISKTLNHIVDLKNFELAEFWIADRDTKQLQLIADHYATGVSGQFKSASGETASFKKGEGLPGSAWKKKEPLFWRNLDKRKSFIRNELAKTTGLKTGFAYPVLDGDDVTGVLVLAVKEDLKTEPYYLPIFSELAVQLASEIKRKQLEVELSRIFDSAPDGIIVSGFDGYLKKVNPAFTEILGYSEEELLSTPFMEFVHPKDREITLQAYENENSGLGKSYFINRYVKKSGKIVWISWSIKVFPEEEVAYSVAKDITDQKELEDLLKQANRLAKIGSWEVDLINNEVYWSDITREIHEAGPGFEPDLETRVNYYKEGESRDKIREALNRAIQYGEQWDLELELITAKGNDRWVRAIGEVEMVNGKPVRIYGSLQGIHQRKIADLKLQERTRHINVIASLNSALLNYENWYEALETHLDEIGEAVQSDRVYYFENRFDPETGEGFASQKLEWCRKGITPQMTNPDLEELPFKEVPELVDPMVKGQPSMKSLSEIKEGTTTRYVMKDQEINTFLAIPVMVQGVFYGFVGFDNCTEETKWSEEEIRTLKTIASNIAVAIERDQMESERRELLEEKNRILDSISDAFFTIDEHWTITYFNSEAEMLMGKTAEQVVGKNIWEEFPPFPDAKVKLPDIYREVFETQQSKSFEYYSPVIGSWFDMSVYPSGNEISVYFKNIDERKYTQEKILQKTRQLDTIARFNSLLIKEDDWLQALDQSLELFGEVADADRVYFFEHSVLEATGQNVISMKVEWVSEGTIREIDNPNHQNHSFDDIGSFINRVIEEGGFNGIISEIEEKGLAEFVSGQQIKSILALPVFTGKEFRGFIGFDDCTTERIWTEEEITFLKTIAINLGSAIENEDAEEALQKAFEEKNAILDSIGDGFFAVDKDFTITYWNRQAEIMSHTRRDDIIGKNLWTVFPEGKDISSYELYHKAIEKQEKQHCEDFFAPLDKWFEISAYPSESGLSVFFKDVTERNKARREIQVSNERFIKVSDASKDAIWDFDVQNENLFWGKGFNSLFGYDLDKTKPTLGFLISRIHPGDRERVAQNIENYMSDASKTDWFEEYKFQRENGSYAYVMDRAVFIRNKNKEVTRVVGAMTDLTRQKEFEESLKQLNIELEQRAKQLATSNAELEQFAFVASHDLQEPLRMITGFLAQLEKKYDHLLDDKGKKYIHFATDGARRMRQIILDLLEYSRVGRIDSERERVDLNALVEDTLSLNRKLISERNAKIQVQEMPVIKASKGPMRQLFQNLVNNALKYHKKGSAPVVDISWSEDENFWHFEVRDNGIGINAQYSQKIFNIFQRLHGKEDYSGSGMGLAICKKIVEEHGGSIGVKSEDGKGSTFYFSIEKNQREIANVE